jgi:hypothetical protein
VLTCRRESPRFTSIDDTATRPHNDANDARKHHIANCRNYRKHCAAIVSTIRALRDRCVANIIATRECHYQARCADSESQFLAMKKFSCPPASGLIAARQNQFFARIASTDSQSHFDLR